MKRSVVIVMFLLAAFGTAGAAQKFNQDFSVAEGEKLIIELESGGSIRIEGGNGSTVSVEAQFSGRDQDNIVFAARRVTGGVEVTTHFREKRRQNQAGGRLIVRVPDRFDLDVRTNGGDIEISGVDGRMAGETLGGRLILSDLVGELDLTTMGGDVRLSDSETTGRVVTMGGNVRFRNVCGTVGAETLGGNVSYDNVKDSCATECREVRISTMGGHVNAPDAPCGAELSTMGGNVRIDRAGKFVKASTMGGNIVVGEVDGWVRATTMGGSIEVTVIGGADGERRDVRLDSKGGDITLTLPGDLSMEIDVTLGYTKRSKRAYNIESDFKVDIRRSDSWSYQDGSPRKYIHGKGTIGDGGNKIRIETIDGDVRILRAR